MSSNIEIFNAILRQQIFLQRFAGGEANKYAKAVDEARRASKRVLKGVDIANLTKARQRRLERLIVEEVNNIFVKANLKVIKDMQEFADYQAGFHSRIITNASTATMKAPTAKVLNKLVFDTGMNIGAGRTIKMKAFLQNFSDKLGTTIVGSIRQGIIAGDSNRDIRRALNVVTQGDRTFKANSLIRTITNHTSHQSKAALYRANSDVIANEKYMATLDGNTTLICAGLDGTISPLGEGPRPPQHVGCRSVITIDVKPEFNAASGVKTTRASRDPKTGKTVHTVDRRTTYNSWLKDQPKSFQDEVLGTGRGKLFREGVPVSKFTDEKFETINLNKLKRIEPLAFEKAGL